MTYSGCFNIVRMTPDTYDFHASKHSEKMFELAKTPLENASKCCCKQLNSEGTEKLPIKTSYPQL